MDIGEEQVRKLLHDKLKIIQSGGNYFELLGLTPDATVQDVKKQYFQLAKVLHPDKVRRFKDEELFHEAEEVFSALTQGYEVLSKERSLQEYKKRLGKGRTMPIGGKKTDPKEEARISFQRGKLLLEHREYAEARKAFERAVKLDPKSAKYHLYLGFAYFFDPYIGDEVRIDKVKPLFEKAKSLDPEDPEVYYAMALYYKSLGEYALEYEALNDALMLDPDYLEAKRELRLLAMRWKKGGKSSLAGDLKDLILKIKRFFSKK